MLPVVILLPEENRAVLPVVILLREENHDGDREKGDVYDVDGDRCRCDFEEGQCRTRSP